MQSILNKEELSRYNRHLLLPELGLTGQEKLKNSKVLVVGAGGLGAPLLLYLAAAGIGRIGIIDDDVEEILDGGTADEREKEKAKSQWSALEAIVGSEPRLKEIAQDLIKHYETRSETQPGKAMIVTMSREICVRLYEQVIAIKPEWHDDDHMKGMIKVVMTASASDKAMLQPHHTNKKQKKDLEKRFKDPSDPLKIVIVRDMWLTGFDAPCLATMYVDKPMQGANLAQAIAIKVTSQ